LKLQGTNQNSLWDTGADVTLVDGGVANELLIAGAKEERLKFPVKFNGIGKGQLVSTRRLITTLKFPNDHKERELRAYVVRECPHGVIIGTDFMTSESIGYVQTGGLIQLHEWEDGEPRMVYSERPAKKRKANGGVIAAVNESTNESENESEITRRPARSKKARRKNLEWWEGLSDDQRELLQLLAQVQLNKVAFKKLIDKLAVAGFCIDEEENRLNDERVSAKSVNTSSVEQQRGTDEDFSVLPDGENVPCDWPEAQDRLNKIIRKHSAVFSQEGSDVGRSTGDKVRIQLAEKHKDASVNIPNYRTPMKMKTVLKSLVDELVDARIIEPCITSKFSSPCLLVPKKSDNGKPNHRLVVDYRRLNQVIENVVYPMPRIQDILSEYGGCEYFSTVDIRHAYYTIELEENSREMTAFSCELGKFQFRFLPQGLKIAPAVFQERITNDMRGIPNNSQYMDDILQGDASLDLHLTRVDEMLERLEKCGYKLKLSKCHFLRKKVRFTGVDISREGISVAVDKVESSQKLVAPKTFSDLKSLLGFTSFLRAHVPFYTELTRPLQSLLRLKNQKPKMLLGSNWDQPQEKALTRLKELLLDPAVLAFPDCTKPYTLYTDASKYNMSAVLMQPDESDHLRPIGYWSKAFKGPQLNWSALMKEARAVMEAVLHYEVFIKGCKTKLMCDHKPLLNFLKAKTKNEMANRWSLAIQEFDIEQEFVSSAENISDCYSRLVDDGIYHKHEFVEADFTERSKVARNTPTEQDTNINEHESHMTEVCQVEVKDPLKHKRKKRSTNPPQTRKAGELTRLEKEALSGMAANKDDNIVVSELTRISDEQVKILQGNDNYCKRIFKLLETGRADNGEFTLRSGLLYRVYHGLHRGRERLPNFALVVPKCLILSVVKNTHEELGHAGKNRMLAALVPKVYWKGMRRHVSEFVRGCRMCVFRHLRESKRPPIRIKPPLGPGKRLAVDVWSGGGGQGKCLTAMCMHSMYPFVKQIDDKKEDSIRDAMLEILAEAGEPVEILSDNGGEFVSESFQTLLRDRKIAWRASAPYSPQTNGILERFHRYLNEQLRITTNLGEKGFWPAVRAAVVTYRKSPHCSSGETPMFLFLGREPTYCIDHLLPTYAREVWDESEAKWDLTVTRLAHAIARKNTCLARLKNKVKIRDEDGIFEVGDRVYLRNMGKNKTKLSLRWLPGFRIVELLTGRTVRIEKTVTGEKKRVALQNLRKTDALSELLQNSNIDVFPGTSKLYFRADDLKDLDWPAITEAPGLLDDIKRQAHEVVRDRKGEKGEQPFRAVSMRPLMVAPKVSSIPGGKRDKSSKRVRSDKPDTKVTNDPNETNEPKLRTEAERKARTERPRRARKRPGYLEDYVHLAFVHEFDKSDRSASKFVTDSDTGVQMMSVVTADGSRAVKTCTANGHGADSERAARKARRKEERREACYRLDDAWDRARSMATTTC
jgi:hypothetical protein